MLKRGRPALAVPDVGPMNALDVFLTLRKRGVPMGASASSAMYAVVANQVGWGNLGLSKHRVWEIRKMFIDFGINPDRIETVPLSEKHQEELAAAMKQQGEKSALAEFREVAGIEVGIGALHSEPLPLGTVAASGDKCGTTR